METLLGVMLRPLTSRAWAAKGMPVSSKRGVSVSPPTVSSRNRLRSSTTPPETVAAARVLGTPL
jgi:hypothetical protein